MTVYRQRTLGSYGRAAEPAYSSVTFPACVGGINALDPLMGMPQQDCIYTYNLMPSEYGMRLRKGYREWAVGLAGDVRTIIPYEAAAETAASDRLWAVTENGIYDVTTFNAPPVQEVVFTTTGFNAGWGVKCEFTNDAADHYLFYADSTNGLHQYLDGAGWSVPVSGVNPGEWSYDPGTGLTGFPVDQVAFVTVHKLRIWVILRNSDEAWYLPVASVAGQLKKFTFGSKMVHGGNLAGLWTWSVDGGDGIDDYLVAVGRGGDALLYRGDDPEITATGSNIGPWTLAGGWFIGEVPESRRLAAEWGADMYVLSTYGLTSLGDLLKGADSAATRISPSAKINRFLREEVQDDKDAFGWSLHVHPADGFLQIVAPEQVNSPWIQYTQNLNTRAWGLWEGVPAVSAESWNSDYFIGSKDGVVYISDGVLDGTMLDGTPGTAVAFRTLTSFQSPNGHGNHIQAGLIRATGVVSGSVNVTLRAIYDYAYNKLASTPNEADKRVGSRWDIATWDSDVWDSGVVADQVLSGAAGVGKTFAVSMRGTATSRITVVGWDVSVTAGTFT